MARTAIDQLKKSRLAVMSAEERAVFDETHEATRLALASSTTMAVVALDEARCVGRGSRSWVRGNLSHRQ